MAIPFEIPKRLSTFVPILEWLSEVPEEELNGDLDPSKIEEFLKARYGELESDEFDKRLKVDRSALRRLVEKEGPRCPWLGFLQAYLLAAPHILADLEELEQDDEQVPPPLTLHVQLPPDFIVENDFGSIRARHGSTTADLAPTAESVLDYKLQNLKQQSRWEEERQHPPFHFTQVNWNNAGGWKVVSTNPRTGYRIISYLLSVPGGACMVELHCSDPKFDESEFEKSLHGARVEKFI